VSKGGFTLVELMVVAIIVAILAAVAIPLMSANKMRARVTEAEAGLGTVRSAMRAMMAETDSCQTRPDGTALPSGPVAGVVPGIRGGDLNGRWFNDAAYSIAVSSASNYVVTATGASSTAPKASEVNGVVVTMNQDGAITRTGL
jgi:prepilin-type N-terminal cleavage/methylation domain-containing protein